MFEIIKIITQYIIVDVKENKTNHSFYFFRLSLNNAVNETPLENCLLITVNNNKNHF